MKRLYQQGSKSNTLSLEQKERQFNTHTRPRTQPALADREKKFRLARREKHRFITAGLSTAAKRTTDHRLCDSRHSQTGLRHHHGRPIRCGKWIMGLGLRSGKFFFSGQIQWQIFFFAPISSFDCCPIENNFCCKYYLLWCSSLFFCLIGNSCTYRRVQCL